MNDVKSYAVFAETVATGSMSAAAKRLGMSPSAVSQTIRALERQTGVMLLHRSTRKLALTEAGERCYPHCRRLLEAASAAAETLLQAREAPSGELRVAAPVGFAAHIAPALAPVFVQWPHLSLRLLVDDEMIDLIEARIDIAVRVGRLPDTNWIARPLCAFEMILCASPDYVNRYGSPLTPQDLTGHQWLALERETVEASHDNSECSALSTLAIGLQGPDGEVQRLSVGVRVASNNQLSLQQMCEQGLGIARLGYADALPSLSRGILIRLLPGWRFPTMPVTAVTPRRDGEPAKVRVAVKALKRYFATLPSEARATSTP